MAISKSFKLAELIRHIEYDSTDDVIKTSKATQDANKKKGAETKTATDQFNLDTFAHASFRAARYIVAMSRGTDFHSTEIMLIHDGTTVSITQYGVLQDATLATFDADISGANVRLKCTPSSATSTTIKFDRTVVDA
tara:strand:+ start:205 stop:615 length:411 start_codon:yes stop_codon:yes gene_type:complete